MRNKILIVDDETDIVSMLKDYFELNGYDTITAVNGLEAIQKAEKQPDIILLDINMPDIDGMEVCMRIRDFVSCPILFLTARIETSDKIKGFSVGADDYIIKPFSIDELGARVAAHLRRDRRQRESAKVHFDDKLAIDYTERSLYYNGEQITLSKKEFGIMRYSNRKCKSNQKNYRLSSAGFFNISYDECNRSDGLFGYSFWNW